MNYLFSPDIADETETIRDVNHWNPQQSNNTDNIIGCGLGNDKSASLSKIEEKEELRFEMAMLVCGYTRNLYQDGLDVPQELVDVLCQFLDSKIVLVDEWY